MSALIPQMMSESVRPLTGRALGGSEALSPEVVQHALRACAANVKSLLDAAAAPLRGTVGGSRLRSSLTVAVEAASEAKITLEGVLRWYEAAPAAYQSRDVIALLSEAANDVAARGKAYIARLAAYDAGPPTGLMDRAKAAVAAKEARRAVGEPDGSEDIEVTLARLKAGGDI